MKKYKDLYSILLGQYSTEKSVMLADKCNSVTFRVSIDCSKYDIIYAVEKIFNVIVKAVRIINVKGKRTKFKNVLGRKKSWKKAIVHLDKGYDINFSEFR